MTLAHFRILLHEFLNKDPDIFPEEAPIIVLDIKYVFVWLTMVKIPSTKVTLLEEKKIKEW